MEMSSSMVPASFTPTLSTNYSAMNESCLTLYAHRKCTQVLIPLFYAIVFIVGLLGNVLALHVIWPNLKKINSTTMYSLNLVISDILFTLFLPLRLIYYARGFHWPLGDVLCKISAMIFYINTYAGLYFMTCLSIDHVIAVVLPLNHRFRFHNARHVLYICVTVWLLVLAHTLPILGMPMTNEEHDGYITCMEYPSFENVPNIAYMLIGAVVPGYGIPLVCIMVCFSILCLKLQRSAKKNRFTKKSGRSRKAIGMICCVSLVFVICYSPYHINLLQYMIRKVVSEPSCMELTAFQVSLHFTVCLMNLNVCLDPFIYFFACEGYKRKLLKLLKMTSADGSSRDVIDGNRMHLNSSTKSTN